MENRADLMDNGLFVVILALFFVVLALHSKLFIYTFNDVL